MRRWSVLSSSPNRNLVDDSCHQSLRGTIEQPHQSSYDIFARVIVGQIMVRRPLDLPDLLLRPCISYNFLVAGYQYSTATLSYKSTYWSAALQSLHNALDGSGASLQRPTDIYLSVAFLSCPYFLIQMHTTAAWPSSAQQVGSICIILPPIAPLFKMAIANKVHFTTMTMEAGLCTYSNPLFHFALCVVSGSLSQSLCPCCLLTMHLEVCASSGSAQQSVMGRNDMACHQHSITLHLGCSYHLHSIHRFLSTWSAVLLTKKERFSSSLNVRGGYLCVLWVGLNVFECTGKVGSHPGKQVSSQSCLAKVATVESWL